MDDKDLYPASDKDGAVKGDKSESGSNSYAKATQAAITKLKEVNHGLHY